MDCLVLCDFGSTYTKLTAVDPEKEEIVGTSKAYTTVQTDIFDGFTEAADRLRQQLGDFHILDMKACSSAAGGLRMVVSGLVPELTAEAARMAALGAGAKVVKVFHHEMTDEDIESLENLKPDIFLLTGGTDGGNSACILENAEILAESSIDVPILIAGNRTALRKIRKIFDAAGKDYRVCENVMPRLQQLNIKPAQDQIREIFLKRIIQAKGLSRIDDMISDILLPTPAAVLSAVKILAEGTEHEKGIGELLCVDPGGATTDVYSIAEGGPTEVNTVLKGLPEPYEKRTVEGDIGMRYSIHGIIEAGGAERVAERAGLTVDEVLTYTKELAKHTDRLPENEILQRLDDALAATAVETAVARHCGRIEEVYTPCGKTFAQTGKDLRELRQIIVTGGALIHSPSVYEITQAAAWSPSDPTSLRPRTFDVLVDKKYILSAMGVLSQTEPDMALRIMKKELVKCH